MSFKIKIFFATLLIFTYADAALYSQQKMDLQKRFGDVRKKFNFAQGFQLEQNNPKAKDLLNKAGINLRRANRQLRGRRPFVANRSIIEANKFINQALKILLKEPMIKRKQKLDELARRAEDIVLGSDNVQAQAVLDNGLKNKAFAYEAYRKNNFRKSLRLYNQAYQQLLIAINLIVKSKQDVSLEFENEAYRFDQFLELNEGIINSSKNQAVKRFKKSALKQVRNAEQARQNSNFKLAIEHYQKATRLLNRALDLALGKTELSISRIIDKVAQLDKLVSNIEQRYDQIEPDKQISILMSRIKQLQRDAHRAIEEKNFRTAFNKAQLALELINRIHKKTKQLK